MSNLNEMMKLDSQNSNIAEMIVKVETSASSIFAKQDVLDLLSLITVRIGCQEGILEELKNKIDQHFDRFDPLISDAEFEISYNNTIELSNYSIDNLDELKSLIEHEIDNTF
jgi:hypothetical protein